MSVWWLTIRWLVLPLRKRLESNRELEVPPISPEAPVLLPVTPQEPESSGLLMEMEEEEEFEEEEGC